MPVELWSGKSQMTEKMREIITAYGVTPRVPVKRDKSTAPTGTYETRLTATALFNSSFEDILFLRPHCYVVADPSHLFEEDGLRENGCILWPAVMNEDMLDRSKRGTEEQQYSEELLVVSRSRYRELVKEQRQPLCEAVQEAYEGEQHFVRWLSRLGFASGVMPPRALILNANDTKKRADIVCHHDFRGERIAQYRKHYQWDLIRTNAKIPGALFDALCCTFIRELRELWTGKCNELRARTDDGVVEPSIGGRRWLLTAVPDSTNKCRRIDADAAATLLGTEMPVDVILKEDGTIMCQRRLKYIFWGVRKKSHKNAEFALIWTNEENTSITFTYIKEKQSFISTARRNESQRIQLTPCEADGPAKLIVGSSTQLKMAKVGKGESMAIRLSANGIGDAVFAVYAAVGAANAGWRIRLHVRGPEWFKRIMHPNLSIHSWESTVMEDAHCEIGESSGQMRRAGRQEMVIELEKAPTAQLRYGDSRAEWYARAIGDAVVPARPATILQKPYKVRFEYRPYAVLAPFAAWPQRDWAPAHWSRLAMLLTDMGYETIAIGTGDKACEMRQTFEGTNTYWAIDHEPDWVIDTLLGCAVLIGGDSGLVHVAGLYGVPTVCIHAQLPATFLFQEAPSVRSLTPSTRCAFCRWQTDRGWTDACKQTCSALQTIGPEAVCDVVAEMEAGQGLPINSEAYGRAADIMALRNAHGAVCGGGERRL